MEKTKFDLEAEEAALIFKKDMSIEIVLPNLTEDETVDFDENQNMFVAMAIAACVDNPDFRQIIGAKLNEMLSTPEPEEDNTTKADCDPSSGCGGCSCG